MGTVFLESEAEHMLRTALGPIPGWLRDPDIVEVMCNPDGLLWTDGLANGLSCTGEHLSAEDGDRIIRILANHVGAEVTRKSPRLSGELPSMVELPDGARFEGWIPPIVKAPSFAIRKPAVAIFTLGDYARSGIMTEEQADILRDAVSQRRNILVAGGTSTGKTTLVNALLAEVGRSDRIILIEDTRELQCKAPNFVGLRTLDNVVSMSELVCSSLRLRPDRIPVGEVRAGAAALDLVKAWGTGHPGGIGTIHAETAIGALDRLEQLIQEVVVTVPRALIADTINVIAVLDGRGFKRRLVELAVVENRLNHRGDYVLTFPASETQLQGRPRMTMRLPAPIEGARITLSLPAAEATAIAAFLKRLGYEDCARIAARTVTYDSAEETDLIWSGVLSLRGGLAEAGHASSSPCQSAQHESSATGDLA